ncbi:hypothetical protein SEA_CURSIVE_183 [Streptomyces phage Cursive]
MARILKIWVDDERPKPDSSWFATKHSNIAILLLKACKRRGLSVRAISLDHDLGGDDTTRPVVLWMCENEFWPETVYVHSMNPIGREWLIGMVERYAPEGTYKR